MSKISNVLWSLTYNCQTPCIFCAVPMAEKVEELTTKESLKLVKTLAKNGIKRICFTGGEPLLRKDFFKIINLCNKLNILCDITTNGILLSKTNAKKLIKNQCLKTIVIGIEGATQKTHDLLRGKRGSFKKTIMGIKNIIKAKQKLKSDVVIISQTLILTKNLCELPQIATNMGALGVDFSELKALKFFNNENRKLIPKSKKTQVYIKKFAKIAKNCSLKDEIKLKNFYSAIKNPRRLDGQDSQKQVTVDSLLISPDGIVFPYDLWNGSKKEAIGNVRENSLSSLINKLSKDSH